MWFNILGFWAVGFTTGYTLTFRFHWGLPGVWWGILSGVMVTGQYLSKPAMMLSQYGLHLAFLGFTRRVMAAVPKFGPSLYR